MAEAATQEQVFNIQRVYLKEVSLEQPNSPGIFLEQEAPAVEIQLAVEAGQVAEGIFEVAVTATVHTKVKDHTLFLLEAKQAGIFEARGMRDDQMSPVLGVVCPQIVYPYLRGNVADMIQRAGFPPVHLGEINFQAMHEQRMQESANAADNAAKDKADGKDADKEDGKKDKKDKKDTVQ